MKETTKNWMKSQLEYLSAKEENDGLTAVEQAKVATLAEIATREGMEDILTEYAKSLDYKTAGKCTRNRKKG